MRINVTKGIREAAARTRGQSVSFAVEGDDLVVETELDLGDVAAALAEAVRDAIRKLPAGPDGRQPFQRTGRFLEGLVAVAAGAGQWAIRTAGDRLNTDRAAIIIERLYELVPLLADPRALLDVPEVRRVMDGVIDRMITSR